MFSEALVFQQTAGWEITSIYSKASQFEPEPNDSENQNAANINVLFDKSRMVDMAWTEWLSNYFWVSQTLVLFTENKDRKEECRYVYYDIIKSPDSVMRNGL